MLRAQPGQAVLVTGASSGLGRHFAIVLARAGYAVAAAARRPGELAQVVAEIEAAGGAAHAVAMDVTDLASVRQGLSAAQARFGPLHGLVNNAGITGTAPLLEQPAEAWDAILQTNLRGAWAVATEAARGMVASGRGGAIVNVASILGLRQANQVSAYATSKAALIQLTKQMALEWARHGIRVNALAPGYIETPLNAAFFASAAGQAMLRRIPARRLGRPEDLDAPLLLLLATAGSYMSGSVLVVDGGHLTASL